MRDGKHVVLYVEDDPDFRAGMRQVLEANDFVMVEAGSGEEGLRIYRETRPDVIIVDLMMEEVDAGNRFLRELRALGNEAPVYMISSVGDEFTMTTDVADLGFSGVFQKPVNSELLIKILRAQLP